jgi:hypothetical protein
MLLPALWLLLARRRATLLTAVAAGAVLAAYPLILNGPITVMDGWLNEISAYQTKSVNMLGDRSVVGLPSAMALVGAPLEVSMAMLAAVAILYGLWICRTRISADDMLGLLLAIQLGLVYGHVYDLVLLAPLAAALWLRVAGHPRLRLGAILLACILFVPDRVMLRLDVPLLTHWLTFVVLFATGWLLYLNLLDARTPAPIGDSALSG